MSALDNIKNESYTFFVIATSDTTYLHYEYGTGREDKSWGDVLTAEQFDTREEAEDFIRDELDTQSNYTVKSVVVNITIA